MKTVFSLMASAVTATFMSAALAESMLPWEDDGVLLGGTTAAPAGELSKEALDQLIEEGETLFVAKFNKREGAGRPGATQAIIPTKQRHLNDQQFARLAGPDAQACSSCHNDPVIGGAGDFVTNVFVSEGFANANFDTSDPQFSNERGTNHLLGAGLIELLAREMSAELVKIRNDALHKAATEGVAVKAPLVTKGVSFGSITALPDGLVDLRKIDGIDTDLVVRPFSQKGVMTSLRQFTVNAMNHHHGMQATERFGTRWTGEGDFDADGVINELSADNISALVAWQATLRVPLEKVPENAEWHAAATLGKEAFKSQGCADCHRTELPLTSLKFNDPGPFDVAGTLNSQQVEAPAVYDLALLEWTQQLPRNENGHVLVPLFGDLKRHTMTDRVNTLLGNELLSQRFVGRDVFMTSELWGIASTAPYGHRNDFTALDEIILAHGGDARTSRDAYAAATREDQIAIIAFLKTLVIE